MTRRSQLLPNGVTGRVAFDSMGDRVYAEYRVINVQNEGAVEVGNYRYSNVSFDCCYKQYSIVYI